MTIAVNHLAPFLLTHLLMDRLTGDSASEARDSLSPRPRGEMVGVRGDSIPCDNSSSVAKNLNPLTPAPLPLSTGGEGNPGASTSAKANARGGVRIINLSSIAHRFAWLDWNDLMAARSYTGYRQYCRSKLMTLMFTYELARRLARTNVTVNAVHPGFVRTSIARDFGWQSRFFDLSAWLFGIHAVKGARTVIWLASAPELAGVSGQYFVRQHPAKTSAASHDEDAARRLWDWSMEMTHLAPVK
jgi:NAD(P)-dependent dehydrogenase (short-subunit alcohol dehydrogenase family)